MTTNSALKQTLIAMATAALGMTGCGGDASTESAEAETTTGGEDAEASCGGHAAEASCGGAAAGAATPVSGGEASCGEGSCG